MEVNASKRLQAVVNTLQLGPAKHAMLNMISQMESAFQKFHLQIHAAYHGLMMQAVPAQFPGVPTNMIMDAQYVKTALGFSLMDHAKMEKSMDVSDII